MVFKKGNQLGKKYWFKFKGGKKSVTCPICSKIHYQYPSEIRRGEIYCSRECAEKHISETYIGEKHWKYIRKEFICKECGKIFKDIPSKNREYCSNSCANKNNSPGYKGADNYNWKGGITPIIRKLRASKDFAIWRKAVFERDDYTCQKCGSKNGLNPHHIVWVSQDISRIFDINNGITLCAKCHQKEHPMLKLTIKGGRTQCHSDLIE